MKGRNETHRQVLHWIVAALPLAAACISSLLPLQIFFRQALIGVVLVWFGVNVLMGVFRAN